MKLAKTFLTLLFSVLSLTIIAGPPLVGSYTINQGAAASVTNFQSFNACADSLNLNGISGNVTITVVTGSGPYTEQVVFNNIAGTAPGAIITLDGNGETIIGLTNTSARHTVRLSNLQYFDITNLIIERDTASTSGFYGIHIFGTGSNINITNCEVYMPATNSTLVGAYIASGSETSILETGNFHNINILNNTASGGGYGASAFGLLSNLASNIVISGNSFYDFHSNGVYLRETNGAIISDNYFDKSSANVTSCNAIQIAQAANINAQIFNNRIRVGQVMNGNVTFRGIYLFNGTGHKVYNNVIHDINLITGNVTGIEIRTGGTAPEIYFNTISIDNPATSTGNLFGIKEELSNTNSILRNNMISITQPTSGNKAGLYLGATSVVTSALNSNYNDIWVPGGNVAMRGTTTPTFYQTLGTWQVLSGQDANSISTDPQFLSVAVPQPTNLTMNNAGIAIPSITTDILGITRGPVPDIGAYEFNTTGLNEVDLVNTISVWPNPSNGVYNIESKSQKEMVNSAVLYDSQGRVIKKFEMDNTFFIVDITTESDGLYFLVVHTQTGSSSAKIVKIQ